MAEKGKSDDRAEKKLPVTGEVGSEGGSYADSTLQVAELEGEVGRTSEAAEPERTDAQAEDVAKYPTDRSL